MVSKGGLDSDVTVLSKIIDIHYYSISEPVPHFMAITAITAFCKNVVPQNISRRISQIGTISSS